MKKRITAVPGILAVFLLLSYGCTSASPGSGSGPDKTEQSEEAVSEAAEKKTQNEEQEEKEYENAEEESEWTLTCEMPDLNPEAIPYAWGGLFLVQKKDGTFAIASQDGEILVDSNATQAVLIPRENNEFMLRLELQPGQYDGSVDYMQKDGKLISSFPGGLGCAPGSWVWYDLNTKKVMERCMEKNRMK